MYRHTIVCDFCQAEVQTRACGRFGCEDTHLPAGWISLEVQGVRSPPKGVLEAITEARGQMPPKLAKAMLKTPKLIPVETALDICPDCQAGGVFALLNKKLDEAQQAANIQDL